MLIQINDNLHLSHAFQKLNHGISLTSSEGKLLAQVSQSVNNQISCFKGATFIVYTSLRELMRSKMVAYDELFIIHIIRNDTMTLSEIIKGLNQLASKQNALEYN